MLKVLIGGVFKEGRRTRGWYGLISVGGKNEEEEGEGRSMIGDRRGGGRGMESG